MVDKSKYADSIKQALNSDLGSNLDQELVNLCQIKKDIDKTIRYHIVSKMKATARNIADKQASIAFARVVPHSNGHARLYYANQGQNRIYLYRQGRLMLLGQPNGLTHNDIDVYKQDLLPLDRVLIVNNHTHQHLLTDGLKKLLKQSSDAKVAEQWLQEAVQERQRRVFGSGGSAVAVYDVPEQGIKINVGAQRAVPIQKGITLEMLNSMYLWKNDLKAIDNKKQGILKKVKHLRRKKSGEKELIDLQEEFRQLELDCIKREWWIAKTMVHMARDDREKIIEAQQIMKGKEMAYQQLVDLA